MTVRSKRNSELKWLHSPTGELFRLAWPIAVSMVSHSVMTLVDTLFVGRLGPAALAAVGVAGITAFTIVCFPMGVIGGVKILVSQAVGAGRRGDKSVYLAAGLVMAAMGGLVCVGAGQLVATLIPGVTASVEAGLMAQVYLSIRVLGAPATLAFTALREYRVALGDSRWPMVSAVLANVFNVILDWLLIVVLDQGVAGAAWATVAASAMQALVLWFSPGRSLLAWSRLRSRHLRAVWRLGAPGGAQWLLEVGSFTAMSWMIAAYGELDMAAHQIAIQVIHFSFLPQAAVAEAASVLTGQAVGANRDELVPGVARRALASAGAYALLCTVVLGTCARWIVGGFTSNGPLAERAILLLYVAAVFQLFDAANMVSRGALKGTGDVRYTAILGIITAWVLTPPLTWLLGFVCDLGAFGAWIALCLEIVVGAFLFWRRLVKGDWKVFAERSRAEIEEDELSEVQESTSPVLSPTA